MEEITDFSVTLRQLIHSNFVPFKTVTYYEYQEYAADAFNRLLVTMRVVLT